MTSWSVVRSISAMRSTSMRERGLERLEGGGRDDGRARAWARLTASSTRSIASKRASLGPDRAHLGRACSGGSSRRSPTAAAVDARCRDGAAAPSNAISAAARSATAARGGQVRPRPTTVRTRPPGRADTPPSASRPCRHGRRAHRRPRRRRARSIGVAAARRVRVAGGGEDDPDGRAGDDRQARRRRGPAAGRVGQAATGRGEQQRTQRRRRGAAGSPGSRDRRTGRCTPAGPGRRAVSIRPAYSAPRNGVPRRASSARIGRWNALDEVVGRPRRAGPGAASRRPSRRCSGPRRRRRGACGRGRSAGRARRRRRTGR